MKNGECRLTNVELWNSIDFYDGRSEAFGSYILQRLPSGLEAYGLEAASESDILNLSFDPPAADHSTFLLMPNAGWQFYYKSEIRNLKSEIEIIIRQSSFVILPAVL